MHIIAQLAINPRPVEAKALEDELAGLYRIRVDDYRIIYKIFDDIVVVEIVRVARRGPNTYVGLS
jgi:mRNA interferase RelE/StbE